MKWKELLNEVDYRNGAEQESGYDGYDERGKWRQRVYKLLQGSYEFHKKPLAFNDEDKTIVAEQDIDFKNKPWRELPDDLKFSTLYGRLNIEDCKLSSWKNFPSIISSWLVIHNCRFTSLKGMPENIWGGVVISHCHLKSLEGCNKKIDGDFDCNGNDLTNLIGGPEEVQGDYYCGGNQLGTLKGIAKKIGGNIQMEDEYHLHSLVGISNMIEEMGFSTGKGSSFNAGMTTIKRGGLGLVAIKGLTHCNFHPGEVSNIINKHLGDPDNIFECQQELIDAGYPEHAQL